MCEDSDRKTVSGESTREQKQRKVYRKRSKARVQQKERKRESGTEETMK